MELAAIESKLFDVTQKEIREFKDFLETRVVDRSSITLDAIKRADPWGDLADYARADSENPELSDLWLKFELFSESMRESNDLWGREE